MDMNEMHEAIASLPEATQKEYQRLLTLASVGGTVKPCLQKHLEKACEPRAFFESVYFDDECRYEAVWAEWARFDHQPWIVRFEPEQAIHEVRHEKGKVLIECNGNAIMVPIKPRGFTFDMYVFGNEGFNNLAADYRCTLSGQFECHGLSLDGTYDVFVANNALIFEKWEFDALGKRVKKGYMHNVGGCFSC